MSNNKIINVKNTTDNSDAVNLQQRKNRVSALSLAVDQVYIKNGSTTLTGNLNVNGHKLINMSSSIIKNDSINMLYVDQKIGESHSSHENRTNIFKYITDNAGEFSADYGISSAKLIDDFDDMPHKIRKKKFFYFAKV